MYIVKVYSDDKLIFSSDYLNKKRCITFANKFLKVGEIYHHTNILICAYDLDGNLASCLYDSNRPTIDGYARW